MDLLEGRWVIREVVREFELKSMGDFCQIEIEISDCTGNKISVGVARPSHVLGQSVPCDR